MAAEADMRRVCEVGKAVAPLNSNRPHPTHTPCPLRVRFAQLQPGNAASSSILATIIEARARGYASSTVDEDELSSGEDESESEEEDDGRLTVVGGSQQECEQPELSFTME
eukprot:COSAG01_NODE_2377_length_7801_cov_4.201117_3_plen_111_part_00